jgi:hypothetical protein
MLYLVPHNLWRGVVQCHTAGHRPAAAPPRSAFEVGDVSRPFPLVSYFRELVTACEMKGIIDLVNSE